MADRWRSLRFRAMTCRWFRNWRPILAAARAEVPLPPLVLRSGLTVYHGPADSPLFIFNEIFRQRCYTRGGFYRPRPADTVLDLGANIGLFTLFLQWRAWGIRVNCFEPAAETRARLAHNIDANRLSPHVSIYPFAVSDRDGEAGLRPGRTTGVRSFFANPDRGHTPAECVRCVTLGRALEMCGRGRVDLLKIDVEGSEVEIVEGAEAGAWERVERVALEFHEDLRPGCRERVLRVLAARGYNHVAVDVGPTGEVGVIRARRS
jgi:FkbM family methyltransferase